MEFLTYPGDNGWSSMNGHLPATPETIRESVVHVLQNKGPLFAVEVVEAVEDDTGASEEQVRGAIWKLIDVGRLSPDDELRLVVRELQPD